MQPEVTLELPNQIKEVLSRLNSHSYQAYIVGKCVRELYFEHSTIDFDVITNAPVKRIIKIFESYTIITDNEAKGEIIVKILGMAVLVSTYRSGYTPTGEPIYTEDIALDLIRRDFSFNAIAYHPMEGIIDPFHGIDCLKRDFGTVAAIGEEMPYVRPEDKSNAPDVSGIVSPFERNPVTILQALGYYASGKYDIASTTKEAILKHKDNVNRIPKSELRTELSWVINGKKITSVLEEYSDVFISLMPEFMPLNGFEQHRAEHSYNLLEHTYKSVGFSSPILTLRYAMLFHSLGKPDCFSLDENERGHFYGHAERASIYAERIMTRMGFTPDDIREVCFIIKNHDIELGADRHSIKLNMRSIAPERLKLLLQCKYANMKAKSPEFEGAAQAYKRLVDAVNEILAFKECYSIEQLVISKDELIELGIALNESQAVLLINKLLEVVVETPVFNTKPKLIQIAEKAVKLKTV